MGTVHRARDPLLDRELAIKMMRTGPHVEPEIKERFFREARACARLQHANVVTVYDLGEYEKSAYIAMELLVGIDWRRAVRERVPFSQRTKCEFMAQVCDGLGHAHRNGIVHRDVKPSNIYIHKGRQVKVLDFGLARLPESQLTLAGRVVGTPNYMAPEQILGGVCDTRSDLFSAAIVFFEFFTGVHPFQAPFIPRRIADGDPDSLTSVDAGAPQALTRIFDCALAKDPDLRYESAEKLAADLRAASVELPDQAPGLASAVSAEAAAQDTGTATEVNPGDPHRW